MFKSKYIILDNDLPVVFSELMTHANVARALASPEKVIAAGFCYIQDNRYVCYGKSISLNVASRDDIDSKILNKLLGASE